MIWIIVLTEQFLKFFRVSNSDTVKCVRKFVGLDDVAIIVEKRRTKFIDRLIDSREYGDLFSATRLSVGNEN